MTQKELQDYCTYNPATGIFTRNNTSPTNNKHKAGNKIGYINKKNGYMHTMINKKSYKLHRLAFLYMTGEIPTITDHDNRVKHDNTWTNLIDSTYQDNSKNRKLSSNNTSGENAICFDKSANRYMLQISLKSKKRINRRFKTLDEAVISRNKIYREEDYHPNHGLSEE